MYLIYFFHVNCWQSKKDRSFSAKSQIFQKLQNRTFSLKTDENTIFQFPCILIVYVENGLRTSPLMEKNSQLKLTTHKSLGNSTSFSFAFNFLK